MKATVNSDGMVTFDKSELLRHVDDFDMTAKDIREIVRAACSELAHKVLKTRDIESQVAALLDRQIEIAIRDLAPVIQRTATAAMQAAIERRIAALARDAAIECTINFPKS